MLRRPSGFCAAYLEHKVTQDFRAVPRVVNFRMKLHGIPLLCDVLDPGDRMSGFRNQFKTGRQLQSFVPVRHPHLLPLRQSLKQHRLGDNVYFRMPVLTLIRRSHLATKRMHHKL